MCQENGKLNERRTSKVVVLNKNRLFSIQVSGRLIGGCENHSHMCMPYMAEVKTEYKSSTLHNFAYKFIAVNFAYKYRL